MSRRARPPIEELDGAVDRDAFLVAGDQQRDRAFFGLAAIRGEMIERRGDEAGDAAFHIDGAAAVQHVARDFAGKRRMRHVSSSPGGTTSVWPAKTRLGFAVPMRA